MPGGVYKKTEKHKANLSLAKKGKPGRPQAEVAKAKLRLASLGNTYALGYHCSEAKRAKMSLTTTTLWQDPVYRDKILKGIKVFWQDPEHRDGALKAMRLGLKVHPNRPEQILMKLLEDAYPSEWAFVGDGQLVIGGKNPDFANINGKKQLIELYGDYWHEGQDPRDRINLFSQYGFKCLIIWEKELAQPKETLKRIASFTRTSWLSRLRIIFRMPQTGEEE